MKFFQKKTIPFGKNTLYSKNPFDKKPLWKNKHWKKTCGKCENDEKKQRQKKNLTKKQKKTSKKTTTQNQVIKEITLNQKHEETQNPLRKNLKPIARKKTPAN